MHGVVNLHAVRTQSLTAEHRQGLLLTKEHKEWQLLVVDGRRFMYSLLRGVALDMTDEEMPFCVTCKGMGHVERKCQGRYAKPVDLPNRLAPGIRTRRNNDMQRFDFWDELTHAVVPGDLHIRPIIEPWGLPLLKQTEEDGKMTRETREKYSRRYQYPEEKKYPVPGSRVMRVWYPHVEKEGGSKK